METLLPCILDDLPAAFGLTVLSSSPVPGGWQNQKWRAVTQRGTVLVKLFSTRRYSPEGLRHIDRALAVQQQAHAAGFPCPAVCAAPEGMIRWVDEHTPYAVMEFLPGTPVGPETVTVKQMESLGRACGQMKAFFAALPVEAVAGGGNTAPEETVARLKAHLRGQVERAKTAPKGFREIAVAQCALAETLPDTFLDDFATGVCHEDFAADNLLFLPDRLSAIVDFDRCQRGFLLHDIGRALLSLTLGDGGLETEKAAAFVRGYRGFGPLSAKDVADALRVTWCVEAPWWVSPEVFAGHEAKTARFLREILWVGANWNELDAVGSAICGE